MSKTPEVFTPEQLAKFEKLEKREQQTRQARRTYYETHKIETRKAQKVYYETHKSGTIRAAQKAYYETHKADYVARAKANPPTPETKSKAQKRYREKHREEINKRQKAWNERNPKYHYEWARKWRDRKAGLTYNYDELLVRQDGKCAICSREPSKKKFHVDHSHKTKVVRGLLCFHCNSILGHSYDTIRILEAAIQYLRRFEK